MKCLISVLFLITLAAAKDRHADCKGWAQRGECQYNKPFMYNNCPDACAYYDSPQPPQHEEPEECPAWAKRGECAVNPGYMLTYCANACAEAGDTPTPDEACEDLDQYCEDWAAHGHCELNPGYMLPNCPMSCNLCGSGSSEGESYEDEDADADADWTDDSETNHAMMGSTDVSEALQMGGGTSISALLGNLLPKAEKKTFV